jgi:hypothetical protein
MNSLLLAAGPAAHSHPGRLLLALAPLVIVALALDVYCLTDLVRAPSVRYLPKVVWALIILVVSFPLGAVLYLFVGRVRNRGTRVPG